MKPHKHSQIPRKRKRFPKPVTTKRSFGILVFCPGCTHKFIDVFRPPADPRYTQILICPFCGHEIEVM